jgi:hypothetical protein
MQGWVSYVGIHCHNRSKETGYSFRSVRSLTRFDKYIWPNVGTVAIITYSFQLNMAAMGTQGR